MKLELKHLAPYLPYGLKIFIKDESYDGKELTIIETLEGIDKNCLITDNYEYDIVNPDLDYLFKPILRPLSHLTKEIEHNGDKFVPYNQLCINSKDIYATCLKNDNWTSIEAIPHYDWGKLIEWHFDVFGLTEQGLAIDIKTL